MRDWNWPLLATMVALALFWAGVGLAIRSLA